MINIFKKLFDTEYKELKRFNEIATKIDALDEEYSKLSDKKLSAKTNEFKKRLEEGEDLEDILVEAFATIREAAYRIIGEKAYFCQLLGGLAIHYGNIAEMKTGEGKTLTTIFPAYVNALTGKGVHVVTVNEYLTQRNAEWMGPVFNFLGLTVGVNLRELSPKEKREVYNCDIMYTTNNELGFDYLRDNMVVRKEDRVGRRLNYCIIDEVDSVLIDEARTPLIISGGVMQNVNLFEQADNFAKSLKENVDYVKEEKARSITLTDEGAHKCEKAFHIDNLYDINNTALVHHINLALKANYFMKNDVDYVVQDGEVVIVDQFTGRLMKGRAFSEGLHQAIEAKEHVKINQETKTLATITFQNLFRMYNKLSGMTGTAKTEEEEFRNIYNMYVICIPTNKPVIREDATDLLYPGKEGKYNAIIRVVEERHKLGQPILIGTIAIETSELLSKMLTKKKIKHEVLNAKNHAREAEIVAVAGQKNAVTIATNMAGRGTDIKLGEGVRELGGLCVLGTERHESRRIDNQLRGRSGRQGDPGYSRFYTSSEDDLLKRFGSDTFKSRIDMAIRLANGGDTSLPLESKMFTKLVTNAQTRIEGANYDSRKNVLKYDDVIRKQRELFYDQRMHIIKDKTIEPIVNNLIKAGVENAAFAHMEQVGHGKYNINDEEITKEFNNQFFGQGAVVIGVIQTLDENQICDYLTDIAFKKLEEKKAMFEDEIYQEFLKVVVLRVFDTHWTEHIDKMSELRQGVSLQSYAQQNPFQIYQKERVELFNKMMRNIETDVLKYLMRAQIRSNLEREEVNKNTVTNDSKGGEIKRAPQKNLVTVGRNDLCPCGSGKKYKYCHGR